MRFSQFLCAFSTLCISALAQSKTSGGQSREETEQVFRCSDDSDGLVNWEIRLGLNGNQISGKIITTTPSPPSLGIDSEAMVSVFNGRISGETGGRVRKLEVEFTKSDTLYITLKDNKRASWTLESKPGSGDVLNVPSHHFIGRTSISKVLKFTQVGGIDTSSPSEAGTKQNANHSAFIGVWIFPEPEPGISPVVLELKKDFSFTMETEGAITDTGKWELKSDRLTLHTKEQGDIVASVKLNSKKQLLWSVNGRRALVLSRG